MPHVDLRNHIPLDFSKLSVEDGSHIKLNLGLGYPFSRFLDERSFSTLILSLETFSKEVLASLSSATVSLYEGSSDFTYLLSHVVMMEKFQEWRLMYAFEETPHSQRMFATHFFLEYIERLSSYLPFHIQLEVTFTDIEKRPSYALETFTRNILSPLTIHLPGAFFSPLKDCALGLVLPPEGEGYETVDEIAKVLRRKQIAFRPIHELLLNQMWHGLDQIIICSNFIREEPLRMVRGFEAAGGTIITYGPKIHAMEEITFEKWCRSG